MGKLILAGSSASTITCLVVLILALAVLTNRNIKDTRILALSFAITWGFEFIRSLWGTIWRSGYIERKPVQWMLNHPVILICHIGLSIGGLLMIRSLTHDEKLWRVCVGVVICVFIMTYAGS